MQKQLEDLFKHLACFIAERDAHYESSWKQRGGQGAFYTIARPWDRFAAIAGRSQHDLFAVIKTEIDNGKTMNDDGTLQACCRDLLSYMALVLVEADAMRQVYNQQHPQDVASQDGLKHGTLGQMASQCSPQRNATKMELLETLITLAKGRENKGIELGQLRAWVELIIEILKAPK